MKNKIGLLILFSCFLFYSTIAHAKEQVITIEKIDQSIYLSSSFSLNDMNNIEPGQVLKEESITIRNMLDLVVNLSCEVSVIIDDTEFNSGYDAYFDLSTPDESQNNSFTSTITILPKEIVKVNAVFVLNGDKLGNNTQEKIGKLKWIFEVKEDIFSSSGFQSSISSSNELNSESSTSGMQSSIFFSGNESLNESTLKKDFLGNSSIIKNNSEKQLPKTNEINSCYNLIWIGAVLISAILVLKINKAVSSS